MTAEEGVTAVFASVLIAAFGSVLSYYNTCSAQHHCMEAGTCYSTHASDYSCSFKNSVTPAGWRALNVSEREAVLEATTRGVCAPGMRQSIDIDSGHVECIRRRSYPSAMSESIASKHKEESAHRQWCGRWIDAGSVDIGYTRWAFFDEEDVVEDVSNLLLARGGSGIAKGDVGKFRVACRSMVQSNAAGAAAKIAYEHLTSGFGDLSTKDGTLLAIGYLNSHFCDTPVSLAFSLVDSFILNLTEGVEVAPSLLYNSLYAVGASKTTMRNARSFADVMKNVEESDTDEVAESDVLTILKGAYVGSWAESLVTSSLKTSYRPFNTPLAKLIELMEDGVPGHEDYVRGLAAYCALASRSVVTGEWGDLGTSRIDVENIRKYRPRHSALGRLHNAEVDEFSVHTGGEATLNATLTTWTTLLPPISDYTTQSARSRCLTAARIAFPDDFDSMIFRSLVSDRLYARLEGVVSVLRTNVHATIADPLIGNILSDGHAWTLQQVMQTGVRIAGAPRGTWAGVTHDFVRPDITSDDGALLMLLKQARAIFLDRFARAARDESACQQPPLMDALSRNAYLTISGSYSCMMLMPGIVVPPFADERFDDASLYARIGYVIAHEFSHVTAFESLWNQTYAQLLLHRYQMSTFVEAIADTAAVAAVVRSGYVTAEDMCAHVSQIWCARVGWIDGGHLEDSDSHPAPNLRGDNVCAFLESLAS